jgi:hypothetical protein
MPLQVFIVFTDSYAEEYRKEGWSLMPVSRLSLFGLKGRLVMMLRNL